MSSEAPIRKGVRLWPAMLLILLAAAAIIILWLVPEMQHQQRYIRTAVIFIVTGLLLLIWLLFLSRLRWTIRLAGFATVVLAIVVVRYSFRIRGVTGDLLPIVEPRWKSPTTLATAPSNAASAPKARAEGEFPQFYGPGRNAVLSGPAIETNWTEHPPKLLWKRSIGPGWSGFAVKDGLAITSEQRSRNECVTCYDVLNGHPVWTHTDETKYATTIAGEGPRGTPTISSNRVYTFGATGILNCLDLQSGNLLWSKNTAKENNAPLPDWGFASSPLLVDRMVVVAVGGTGGSLVAYSAGDGTKLWSTGQGGTDYSSPLDLTLLGTRQIVLFGGRITSRDLNGQELWSYPWPGGHPHITPPLVISTNLLLVASGYGTGSELLRLGKTTDGNWTAEREWKSMAPKSKFGPLFHVGDNVYGLDDGILSCVELKTGQRKWKDGRYGHGQGLLVQDLILLTSEKGEIILIQPDPEKLVELTRFKVFDDKTWNPPALAGEYLLLRNDKQAACLQLHRKKGLEKS